MSLHLHDWLKKLGNVVATVAPILVTDVAGPEGALIGAVITTVVSHLKNVEPEVATKIVQALSTNTEFKSNLDNLEKLISDVMLLVNRHEVANVSN